MVYVLMHLVKVRRAENGITLGVPWQFRDRVTAPVMKCEISDDGVITYTPVEL